MIIERQIPYKLTIKESELPQLNYDSSIENNLAGLIITQYFMIQAQSVNEELRRGLPSNDKQLKVLRKDEKLIRQTISNLGYFIAKFAANYPLALEEKEKLTNSVTKTENQIPSQNL